MFKVAAYSIQKLMKISLRTIRFVSSCSLGFLPLTKHKDAYIS